MSIKRVLQVKIFEGSRESVEHDINEFIEVFSTEMIRDIKIIPGRSPGDMMALIQFESVML